MQCTDELVELLGRLNADEDPDGVNEEAQEFLATISPGDLASAEQSLVHEGIAPEELRQLCSAHLEMLEDELDEGKIPSQAWAHDSHLGS